jgi:hypothetical protein
MAFKIVDCDNVRESFAISSPTATISLGGAVPNSRAFSSVLSNGDTFFGVARSGAQISVGIFTYTSGSPGTVAQTTVFYSTNSNTAVTFSSGTGEIFMDAPSRLFDELNLSAITVASATTTDIGAIQAGKIIISGTTTITSLGTTAHKRRFVHFSGALILTHNATSLILPGAANITTVAGDTALFLSDSSGNWRCYGYFRAGGLPQIQAAVTIASATTADLGSDPAQSITISGTTTITSLGSSAPSGAVKFVEFSGALTLTHNATSLILPGAANIVTVAGDTAVFRHEGSGNWRCLFYSSNGAWIAYTPTITTTGTFTTASATGRYKVAPDGKTVFITVTLNITTVGTGSLPTLSIPFAASAQTFVLFGRETAATGSAIQGVIPATASAVQLLTYNNVDPSASGRTITASGIYERA